MCFERCACSTEHPDELELPADVPLAATYFLFQKAGGRFIRIDDALHDPALSNRPARAEVRSYIGVPHRTIGGQVIGSACHFSLAPHREDADIDLLETLSEIWLSLRCDNTHRFGSTKCRRSSRECAYSLRACFLIAIILPAIPWRYHVFPRLKFDRSEPWRKARWLDALAPHGTSKFFRRHPMATC